MNKSLLFSTLFGLCLIGLGFSSCSQDDDSFSTTNTQIAYAPASQNVAASTSSDGLDSLIAQIVSNPEVTAKVVDIKSDNLTGEIDITFDPSYITETQSQSLKAPVNGWKYGGHVTGETDAMLAYFKIKKAVGNSKVVYFKLVKDSKGEWDIYYKTANK